MGIMDVSSITTTNLDNELTKQSISSQDTDIGTYTPDWSKWHGIYRDVPELGSLIDKVCLWVAGLKMKAKDPKKQIIIDKLRGNGKDTATTINLNLLRASKICGDSFAEIIRNKRSELINLKPINSGTIQIHQNDNGIITKYTQLGSGAVWQPEEMFHLMWNRIGDENHGISTIEKLQQIILYRKTAHEVMNTMIERHARPIPLIEVDSEDPNELAAVKTKWKDLIDKKEAMVYPKDTLKLNEFSQKFGLDPIMWMNYLNKYFIQAEGVPMVILGTSGNDTEGEAKILHLAYEQLVKYIQHWYEEQWNAQIGFEIELEKPTSIDPLVLTDTRKSGKGQNLRDVDAGGQNK